MPKFHEIYATTKQPFKIRCVGGQTATCDGERVVWNQSGALVSAVSAGTWEWELVIEPTVTTLLHSHGYHVPDRGDVFTIEPLTRQVPSFRCAIDKRPGTVEKVAEIIAVLDKYRDG